MNDSVLSCQKLTKRFDEGPAPVDVLQSIDLTVAPGEQVAIVGSSGSGKSTLLHLLGGLDTPTSGEIWVNGEKISTLSERARGRLRNHYLGFIYQFHHLLPEFSLLENVCMPLLIRGESFRVAREKARDLLDKVGLLPREAHRLGELSGGERQRGAIVRALVTSPACVLADEPTGNLDRETADRVYDLLLTLNREHNTSLVIVTHDHAFANRMDRLFNIEKMRLKQVPT